MDLYLFAIRGTAAEPVAKWLARHFDNHTLHLQVRATPDGRLICPDRQTLKYTTIQSAGDHPEANNFYLVWDAPLIPHDGPCVLLMQDVLSTFTERLRVNHVDPALYNLDPIVRELWKSYAKEFVIPELLPKAVRINCEHFRSSWEARDDVEKALGLGHLEFHDPAVCRFTIDRMHPELRAAVDDATLDLSTLVFGDKGRVQPTSERTAFSLFNEGVRHFKWGRFDMAIKCYRESLAIEGNTNTKRQLANALTANREFVEAEEWYEDILARREVAVIGPDTAKYHHEPDPAVLCDLGFCLLAQGKEGHGLLEHRFECLAQAKSIVETLGASGQYKGGPLPEELTLWMEQGFGDQIQLARYIPMLQTQVGKLTVACAHELVPLFRTIPGIEVVPKYATAKPKHWLASMSCPVYFGTDLDPRVFNVPVPYKTDEYMKVGVAWQGNLGHPDDGFRSMSVELLKPLHEVRHLYSLQHAEPSPPWMEPLPPMSDFLELAKHIQSMHFVVSVDTAVSHLAGSLGIPCWLMLSWKCDHRWQTSGITTPLYPRRHHLFRQPKMFDWQSVVTEIRDEMITPRRLQRILEDSSARLP